MAAPPNIPPADDESGAILARMQARAALPGVGQPPAGVVRAAKTATDRLAGRYPAPLIIRQGVGVLSDDAAAEFLASSAATPAPAVADPGADRLLAWLDETAPARNAEMAALMAAGQAEDRRRRKRARRARILRQVVAVAKTTGAVIGWTVGVIAAGVAAAVGLQQLGAF